MRNLRLPQQSFSQVSHTQKTREINGSETAHTFEVVTRNENTRDTCSSFRCIEYQYFCTVRVKGEPVYLEAPCKNKLYISGCHLTVPRCDTNFRTPFWPFAPTALPLESARRLLNRLPLQSAQLVLNFGGKILRDARSRYHVVDDRHDELTRPTV